MLKKSFLLKSLVVVTSLFGLCLVSGGKVEAESVDLRGCSARIVTENDKNFITNSKGKWELNETTQLLSNKCQVITLNNTIPANIDSINIQKDLEIRGKGELNLNTNEMYGINVSGNLFAFTNLCYGSGKVNATGAVDGIHVEKTLKLVKGNLEGHGQQHGILSNRDTYVFKNAQLTGVADENNQSSIGVWSNKQITACGGSAINGTGYASGVYTNGAGCKYIYSDLQSTITGSAADINGSLSAIHGANNAKLKACSKSNLVEEYDYTKSNENWSIGTPINITGYQAIRNNMVNFKKYNWTMDDGNVSVKNDGLILGGNIRNATLIGRRTDIKSLAEKVCLTFGSNHIVKVTNVQTGDFFK